METFGWQRHTARTSGWIGQGREVVWELKWSRGRGKKNQNFAVNSLVSAGTVEPANEPAETTQMERGDESNKRQRVEAVLLLSRTPIPTRKLSQLAGLADATEARTLVRQINQIYIERGRAFRAEEVAGGIQLLTRPQLAPWLRRLGHIPKSVQLTPPAMETLAIVAYRQPVLRADIEAIRGVACGEILKQLMERDLVRISGRSEELGRPYLYSTSKHFLQIFGLRGADALPALEEASIEINEQPVTVVPEEDLDVSTAVADLVTDNPECDNDAYVDLSDSLHVIPVAVDDDEDEVFADDDEEEDFDDDDDDWDDDEEEDDLEEEDAEEVDAEWEEVEDEEWDEDEEEAEEVEEDAEVDAEEEDDVDDDWVDDDDDDDADDDDDEDEWD
jgi:segregation and condensation protein B